jgi:hypothetical protein
MDQYDSNGRKMACYRKIEFGPDWRFYGPQFGVRIALAVKFTSARAGPIGWALSGVLSSVTPGKVTERKGIELPFGAGHRIASSKADDDRLLEFAKALEGDKTKYNAIFFNCQHFARALEEWPMKPIPDFTWNPLPGSTNALTEAPFGVSIPYTNNIWHFDHQQEAPGGGLYDIYKGPNGEPWYLYNAPPPSSAK